MRRRIVSVTLVAAVAGCMVGPKYQRPDVPTPAGYRGADSSSIVDSAKSIADLPWFEYFRDTTLQRLVHEAIVGNFDLRIATTRIAQAEAQYGIARSAIFPQVTAGAGATANQYSINAGQVPSGGAGHY